MNRTILSFMAVWGILFGMAFSGCSDGQKDAELASLKNRLAAIEATEKMEQENLTNFDDLDFRVYSGQEWGDLDVSHAADIVVHWPDGRTTKGIETHIDDLKGTFVFAPDTHIKEHPIKIASGEWTAVMGYLEGTYTEPTPTADGEAIPPTGKAFRVPMVTIGRWADGVMVEEWLMWDNQAFMKQIGLAG